MQFFEISGCVIVEDEEGDSFDSQIANGKKNSSEVEFPNLTIRYVTVSTENVTSHLRDLDISTFKVGSEFVLSDASTASIPKDNDVFSPESPTRSVDIYVYGITVSVNNKNCADIYLYLLMTVFVHQFH